jgi:hypothetical protein
LEALNIRRTLSQKNPKVYMSDLAMTLNDLGVLHKLKSEYGLAEQTLIESLKIRRKLAKNYPQVYTLFVATIKQFGRVVLSEKRL